MKIVADENILFVHEAFEPMGEVISAPAAAIDRTLVADADMLLVRSVTKVDAGLLEGSNVRFVGTATIGVDHIDLGYLDQRGIAFSSAPGSNATSVAEYLVAALFVLQQRHGLQFDGLKLGIVGVGNVGSRVLPRAQALGFDCVLCDPPLADRTGDDKYSPLEAIFACDIITLHVPLMKAPPYPTWHLVDEDFLAEMKPGALLINTSRGAVVDNSALKAALERGELRGAVLDVWEGEPLVDLDLLQRVDIATPHIAGYSLDGKVKGTQQIYEALCTHLGVTPQWDPKSVMPHPECPTLTVDAQTSGSLSGALEAVYDIMRDDGALRAVREIPENERASFFQRLRKEYPRRREFYNTHVTVDGRDTTLEQQFLGLGFRC